MLKKTITYTDYNGVEQKDECYFNLSKAELTEMEFSKDGGFENYITKIAEEKNNREIFNIFKEIILKSYGRKSADGKQFIKKTVRDGETILLRDEFEQSEAFSELMVELMSGGEKAFADFINALIPKELAEEIAKQRTSGNMAIASE